MAKIFVPSLAEEETTDNMQIIYNISAMAYLSSTGNVLSQTGFKLAARLVHTPIKLII